MKGHTVKERRTKKKKTTTTKRDDNDVWSENPNCRNCDETWLSRKKLVFGKPQTFGKAGGYETKYMPNIKQWAVTILSKISEGCDHNSVGVLSSGNTDQRFNKVEMNQALSSFLFLQHTVKHFVMSWMSLTKHLTSLLLNHIGWDHKTSQMVALLSSAVAGLAVLGFC